MKFASFVFAGRPAWGLVEGGTVAVLSALAGAPADLKSALAADGLAAWAGRAAEAPRLDVTGLNWLPVVPRPDKILCIGLNYEDHRLETGRAEVAHPTVFTRFANTQIGHEAPILRPKVSSDLDFEGELAVIIGRPGRYIAQDDALRHVAGFSIYNDVSVRDFQAHTHQYTPGKNFPGTGAFGPWMVTPDEMGPLDEKRIETRLNGEVVQRAVFAQMIFDIGRIIAYCSSFTRLEPGDVIATGTPGGVGFKRNPPLWLRAGDVVTVTVEGIGTLSNPVADEVG